MVNATHRPFYSRERDLLPIVQWVWWDIGPVWTGAENCAPTVIRSLERPDRSESPYLLRGLTAEHYTSEALLRYIMYSWAVRYRGLRYEIKIM
jgi:hypothetical protein